jgi:hypothetical protein
MGLSSASRTRDPWSQSACVEAMAREGEEGGEKGETVIPIRHSPATNNNDRNQLQT